MKPVVIDITSDFICPWCWIAHQNLKKALQEMTDSVAPSVRYLPYELNPNMRKDGMNRRLYRSTKFGNWARSQAMDDDVTLAGARAGVHFDYAKVELTPNTRLAHRLMYFAQLKNAPELVSDLYDAIFAAYFSDGRDIGSLEILADIAVSVGFDRASVRSYLSNDEGDAEVTALEDKAQATFVRSVPTVRIGGAAELTGAQPAFVFSDVLTEVMSGAENVGSVDGCAVAG